MEVLGVYFLVYFTLQISLILYSPEKFECTYLYWSFCFVYFFSIWRDVIYYFIVTFQLTWAQSANVKHFWSLFVRQQ